MDKTKQRARVAAQRNEEPVAVLSQRDTRALTQCDALLSGAMDLMREAEADMIASNDMNGFQMQCVRGIMRAIRYVQGVERRTQLGDATAVPQMLTDFQQAARTYGLPAMAIEGGEDAPTPPAVATWRLLIGLALSAACCWLAGWRSCLAVALAVTWAGAARRCSSALAVLSGLVVAALEYRVLFF